MNTDTVPTRSFADVRSALLERREIALLDVREEDVHAQAHPLFAANFPLSRIELDAWTKLPRRDVCIVTLDDGEGEAERAAHVLTALGYKNVSILAGGISGWRDAGGELFRDVNVPSKAFGELVDHLRQTPSLPAEEVRALIDHGEDLVIVDVRRFDEYQTMSIPTATSVPGGELVLSIRELAPDPTTRIVVNCAGRTRSIVGTQSLINARLPNPVAALRNGTIGWLLAGQGLHHGAQRRAPSTVSAANRDKASDAARLVADRAGVQRTTHAQADFWRAQTGRTTYFFDVRTPEDFATGHLPGFLCAPGGQLVQETEMFAPVRGARMVLADLDGVRANMTASWVAQMAWDVYVIDGLQPGDFCEQGFPEPKRPAPPAIESVSADTLAGWLRHPDGVRVLDVSASTDYRRAHVPGAHFILRSRLSVDLEHDPRIWRYVLTCRDGQASRFAAHELRTWLAERYAEPPEVCVLEGGHLDWRTAGHPEESGLTRLLSQPLDRYRRPYEGADNPKSAMQAYLDWEYELVAQLERDGTHGFCVL